MTRRFDSLAMSLRAMELVRIWRNQQWHSQHVNSALVSMPDYMIQRMDRAAHYLFRRVRRMDRAVHCPDLEPYCGSWIVSRRATGEVIGEFFDRANVAKFNPETCLIETAAQYLARIRRRVA